MTRQSLRVEYIATLGFGGMIVPQLIFDDVFGLGVAWPAAISLIALTDFIMRWGRSTENTVLQYGAFEWVFHRLDENRLAAGANR